MKLAITGSRKYEDYEELEKVIKLLAPEATTIITGGAEGADKLAARYAKAYNLELVTIRPDYKNQMAKVAPLLRNTTIVNEADKVITFITDNVAGHP